jgi:hypothetical protein
MGAWIQIFFRGKPFLPKTCELVYQGSPIYHLGPHLTAHNAVIRVYDAAGNVIATHEHAGGFREP